MENALRKWGPKVPIERLSLLPMFGKFWDTKDLKKLFGYLGFQSGFKSLKWF